MKKPLSEGTVDPSEIELKEKEGSISTVDAVVLQKDSAEADGDRSSQGSNHSDADLLKPKEEVKVGETTKVCASNEFEREEKRDL